jgi:hypothetical protein
LAAQRAIKERISPRKCTLTVCLGREVALCHSLDPVRIKLTVHRFHAVPSARNEFLPKVLVGRIAPSPADGVDICHSPGVARAASVKLLDDLCMTAYSMYTRVNPKVSYLKKKETFL